MIKKDDKFLSDMRKRYELALEADSDNRNRAIDDVRFVTVQGEQWDDYQKRKRKTRPCYEFNRLRQHIRQVTGDQRQNRPGIKLRAVEESDKDSAEVLQGLIRNIEAVSNAEKAYDTAFEWAVTGGFGVWRLTTEYSSDDTFDQDIRIVEVTNPFRVYFDPAAQEFDRRDANFAFVVTFIPKDDFKHKFPDAEMIDFEGANYELDHWIDDDTVTVAEYWYKEYKKKTLVLLSNGITQFKDEIENIEAFLANGVTVVREREVEIQQVKMCLCTGAGVIQEADWAGKFIPIVPVYGDVIDIDGEFHYSGMVRFGKDAQRVYNYHRTTMIETIANAPKVPYLVTPEQIKGFESLWKAANSENMPFLPYNPDPRAGGMPQRSGGVDVPAALITASQYDAEDLKAVTGQFDASMGMAGNETSGRAILARQREGDTATFSYIDNLSRAIKFTGEILVDLIPKIYDTERVVRVLGVDGGEKWVALNKAVIDPQTGQLVIENDLTRGKYDVAVTVGASYSTQRQEAAEAMLQMMNNPALAPVVADLLAKNLDIPNSDELEKRLRKIGIKAGVITPTEDDLKQGGDDIVMMLEEQKAQEIQALTMQAEQVTAQLTAQLAETKAKADKLAVVVEQTKLDKENDQARILLEREKLRLDIYAAETDRMKLDLDNKRIEMDAEIKQQQIALNEQQFRGEMALEIAGKMSGDNIQVNTTDSEQKLNDLARYD